MHLKLRSLYDSEDERVPIDVQKRRWAGKTPLDIATFRINGHRSELLAGRSTDDNERVLGC